jgi:hypothetical protein
VKAEHEQKRSQVHQERVASRAAAQAERQTVQAQHTARIAGHTAAMSRERQAHDSRANSIRDAYRRTREQLDSQKTQAQRTMQFLVTRTLGETEALRRSSKAKLADADSQHVREVRQVTDHFKQRHQQLEARDKHARAQCRKVVEECDAELRAMSKRASELLHAIEDTRLEAARWSQVTFRAYLGRVLGR